MLVHLQFLGLIGAKIVTLPNVRASDPLDIWLKSSSFDL